jgi:hypothetical protein
MQYPYILHSFIWTRNLDLRKKYKKDRHKTGLNISKYGRVHPFWPQKHWRNFWNSWKYTYKHGWLNLIIVWIGLEQSRSRNCRSQWPRGLRRGSAAARLLGMQVGISTVVSMSLVIVVCCQVEVTLMGRSLVQRSPTDCDVSEYDRESSIMRRPWPTGGLFRRGKK